jgi:small conductance mechanosensitive channel
VSSRVIESLRARFAPKIIAEWLLSVTPGVISAVLTFLIFWLLYLLMSRILNFAIKKASLDQTLSVFFTDLLKYVVLGSGLLAALSELGINTASIIASLGVAGLTIGFAAKDTLSNLMSGLFIFWDRPFTVGDIVIIAGQYGKVSEVTLRSTRIVTPDGKMISFPNSKVIDAPLTSFTNFPNLRLTCHHILPVNTDLDKVRKEMKELFNNDQRFLKQPAPAVNISEFNSNQLKLEFQVWISDETSHLELENQFKETIFNKYCKTTN